MRADRGLSWLAAALLAVWAAGAIAAAGQVVSISNEFIRIRVNAGPEEAGRLAVETTGGDPSRTSDNEQVLIYGAAEPWTSYTTVWVEGQAYVFGGPTQRRAGKGAPVGVVVDAPQVVGDTIKCTTRFGDIEVRQELGFARSPTTRVKDAARIAYYVTNRGAGPRSVGLRIMLDTMLGANDGAPLRAGERAVTTATRFVGSGIPDYWQAFDSLGNPAVISQGVLRAAGVTPPDRMEMVDWGTLADHPWDFDFPEGADFTRAGEVEQDTAVALYWEPRPLAPGETRMYATLYGVGGVTLSPAQLSLGLTAPAEVDYDYDDPRAFSVLAYIENSGGFESRGTRCRLEVGRGLAIEDGVGEVGLGLLRPGETRQVSWRVRPTGDAWGPLTITASVTSENIEPNRVVREVVVNSPPRLAVTIEGPRALEVTPENRYSPNPFELRATVRNEGAQAAGNLVVEISLPDGLRPAGAEPLTQVRGRLGAGESASFAWRARATGMPTGELTTTVSATAAGARRAEARHVVRVPWLTPELRVYPPQQTVPPESDGRPTMVPISVRLAPAREFTGGRVSLRYDPAVLTPLYVSRGEAFVEAGRLLAPWTEGRIEEGVVRDVGGERADAPPLNAPEVTLFTVVFMVRAEGATGLELEETTVLGAGGRTVDHRAISGTLDVRAAEGSER